VDSCRVEFNDTGVLVRGQTRGAGLTAANSATAKTAKRSSAQHAKTVLMHEKQRFTVARPLHLSLTRNRVGYAIEGRNALT
jgi:hypothetical protein